MLMTRLMPCVLRVTLVIVPRWRQNILSSSMVLTLDMRTQLSLACEDGMSFIRTRQVQMKKLEAFKALIHHPPSLLST